jgi:hypothetical protein
LLTRLGKTGIPRAVFKKKILCGNRETLDRIVMLPNKAIKLISFTEKWK